MYPQIFLENLGYLSSLERPSMIPEAAVPARKRKKDVYSWFCVGCHGIQSINAP